MATPASPNPILDERWLNWAAFWVTYQTKVRAVLVLCIVALEAGLLLYSAYTLLDMYVISVERDTHVLNELARGQDVSALHAAISPVPIAPPVVTLLPASGGDGRYDILLRFVNKNADWIARLTYVVNDVQEEAKEIIIYGNDERVDVAPRAALSLADRPSITVTKVTWQRVRDPKRLLELRPNFEISEPQFSPGRTGAAGQSLPDNVSFTLENRGPYGYWNVGLTALLLQGESPVAARRVVIEQVKERESRFVLFNMFSTTGAVSKVVVLWDVDILDASNILRAEGPVNQF